MTYDAGSVIAALDINAIIGTRPSNEAYTAAESKATLGAIFGVGYGSTGYGQTSVVLSPVVGYSGSNTYSNTVSVVRGSDWANVVTAMSKIALHQGTSLSNLPSISTFAAGNTISSVNYTGFDWSGSVTQLSTNKLLFDTATMTESANWLLQSSRTAVWSKQVYLEAVVDFGSEDHARYYFNSGGEVRLKAAIGGGTPPPPSAPVTLNFSSSGSFTIPTGVTRFTITNLTGGGGGGGAGREKTNGGGGGGGGSGGLVASTALACNPGDVVQIVVGSGGIAGANGQDSTVSVNGSVVLQAGGGGAGGDGNNGVAGAGGAPGSNGGAAGSPGEAGTNDGSSGNGGAGASQGTVGTGGAAGTLASPTGGAGTGHGAGGGGGAFLDRTGPYVWYGGAGAGGQANLVFTPSGTTNTNSAWANLIGLLGTVRMGRVSTTAPNGTGSNLGYYNLSDTYQTVFNLPDTATGTTNNYIRVEARRVGYAGVNGGNGTGIQVKLSFNDAYGGLIAGTLDGRIYSYRPSTALVIPDPLVTQITGLDGGGGPAVVVFNDRVDNTTVSNYDLLARAKAAIGYDPTQGLPLAATITVTNTGIVTGTIPHQAAMTINPVQTSGTDAQGLPPNSTVRIVNSGIIAGLGGGGGRGAPSGTLGLIQPGAGGDGYPGIYLQSQATIINSGIIGGGGGGGGGGGEELSYIWNASAGGGGGGACYGQGGQPYGIGPAAGVTNGRDGQPGAIGGLLTGGAGGTAGNSGTAAGGRGGDLGQPGQAGQTIDSRAPGGAGGLPGPGILGQVNILPSSILGDLRGGTDFKLTANTANTNGSLDFAGSPGASQTLTSVAILTLATAGVAGPYTWSQSTTSGSGITITSTVPSPGSTTTYTVTFGSSAANVANYTGTFLFTVTGSGGAVANLSLTVTHTYVDSGSGVVGGGGTSLAPTTVEGPVG